MPTSSSGCGCGGTRAGARAPLAATLPTAVLRAGADHRAHTEPIGRADSFRGGVVPPMEMLGGGGGISVIDPASVLTRLWWFDGRFLRAEGFRVDQEYVRNLVALSNLAVGSGVVHGFDADLVGSATVRVGGGLALAPSGRVVHLPSATDLAIAELVARSTGTFDPARNDSPGGRAEFAPCPPDTPAVGPDQAVAPIALYVLTVASAEALCGEEERFGQLCGDACATDADRSVAVEGVRFRLRPVTLDLPTSRRVPFSALHLRSRVASAYYQAERRAVASMISGAGLRRMVWCDGAEPIGGDEVPLAVLDRAGGLTSFVDGWTARRELVETSPQRYWQWRMAMRPLDVFLAQVLQFQCQLADAPEDGPTTPGTDPCAAERTVLGDVHALLDDLGERGGEAVLERLRQLRGRVTDVLAGTRLSPSGSLLIDHGIVETPSAGYLPVDPRHDVRQQVGAWFGPGVDLRFCAVRPDFVPEAFQEAQHMERISLTRGVDDPAQLEEVDVLVPGGTFARTTTDQAFTGRLDLLPMLLGEGLAEVESAALSLSAVARDQVTDGWSWTLAGYGEVPHRLGMEEYTRAMRAAVSERDEGEVEVHRESASTLGSYRASAGVRILREGSLARARASRLFEAGDGPAPARVADHAVQPDERRPMVAWADLETARPLDVVEIGGTTSLRVRLTSYSRAKRPSIADLVLTGGLEVTDRRVEPIASGGTIVRVATALDGSLEVLTEDSTGSGPYDLRGSSVEWRLARTNTGVRLLGVELGLRVDSEDRPLALSAIFSDTGSPRKVQGRAVRGAGEGLEPAMVARAAASRVPIAVVSLEEGDGVLALGTPGHDLATSVIDVLGAALATVGRGDGFREQARRRLLPESVGTDVVAAQSDWVMFHRRRTKVCGGEETPQPTRLLRYRWLHSFAGASDAVDPDPEAPPISTEMLRTLLRRYPPRPVGMVEFEEGSTAIHSSVPALRAAWSAAERGQRMPLSVTGRWGTGEGPQIERGRLSAGVAAVSNLIDTTGNRAFVLAEMLPELQSEGTDGVFVTFGVETDVVRSTSLILAVNFDQLERLREELPQFSDLEELEHFCAELGIEVLGLEFADDDLENAEDLGQWWGGKTVKEVQVVFDRRMPPGSEEAGHWTGSKYPKVGEAIGFPHDPQVIPDVEIDLGGGEAAIIVSTPYL